MWLTAMIEAKTPIKGTGDNLRGRCLSRTGVYLSDLHSVSLQRPPQHHQVQWKRSVVGAALLNHPRTNQWRLTLNI